MTERKRRNSKFNWDLIQEHINEGYTYPMLLEVDGVSRATVNLRCRQGLLTRPNGRIKNPVNPTKRSSSTKINWSKVQEIYNQGMSRIETAHEMGISTSMMDYASKKGWIQLRTVSESVKLAYEKHPELRRKHDVDSRKRISNNIKRRYDAGWMPKAGRCAKIEYNSIHNGTVLVDGTWELKVASWLDSVGLKWTRNKQRFPYIDSTGKERTYTPDFYVDDFQIYIEVKGYETELDRLKWKCFPHKLLVWKREQIFNLTEGELNGAFNNAC